MMSGGQRSCVLLLSTERTDGVRWEGEGAGGNGCGRRKEGGGGLTSARFLDRLAAPSSSPPLDERFRAWRRAGAWFAASECACHADSSGHPGKGASIASQLRGKTDEVKPLTLASLAPSRRVGVNDSVPQLQSINQSINQSISFTWSSRRRRQASCPCVFLFLWPLVASAASRGASRRLPELQRWALRTR